MNKPFLSITKSTILGALVLGQFLVCGIPTTLMAEEMSDVLDAQIESVFVPESELLGSNLVETEAPEQAPDKDLFEDLKEETKDETSLTPALSIVEEGNSSVLITGPMTLEQVSAEDVDHKSATEVALTAEQTEILVAIGSTLGAISEALVISDEVEFTTELGNNEEPVAESRIAISEEFGADSSVDSEEDHDVGSENSFQTESIPSEGGIETAIGVENSFQTKSIPTTPRKVSAQMSFMTLTLPEKKAVVSAEHYFDTLSGSVEAKVSEELTFVTADDFPPLPPTEDPEISPENSFVTLSGTVTAKVSSELSFVTSEGSSPTPPQGISPENSFVTLPYPDSTGVSPENSFVTKSSGGGGGGGSSSGGGGSSSGSYSEKKEPELAPTCPIYLKEFIRYGRDNNPHEVIKLQLFLKYFEGYDVPVSGHYDLRTFRAVEDFQLRYRRDVLGPWGISDPTGYVFITTTLAINNIYCGRDTANSLDLRNIIGRHYQEITGESLGLTESPEITVPTTTASSTLSATTGPFAGDPSEVSGRWRLLAALGILANFIGDNLCWLLNLLLLAIILFLLWLLWRDKEDEDNNKTTGGVGATTGTTLTDSDEQYLSQLAREEAEKGIGITQAVPGVIYLGSQEEKAVPAPAESEGAIPLEALFDDKEDSSLSGLSEKELVGGGDEEVDWPPVLGAETTEEVEEKPFVSPDQESLLEPNEA